MSRVGPNQDINDPNTLEQLREVAEISAVLATDHNSANDGITGDKAISPLLCPDNVRIIPITTLLRKQDGSEIEITGFTEDGAYKPEHSDLYAESVINTYINQPERFRAYYDRLVAIINAWSNRDNYPPVVTEFVTGQVTDIDISTIHRGWAESNISIRQKDGYATVDQSDIPISIDWQGSGPINYNSNTYPQLISAFSGISLLMGESPQPYLDVTDVLIQGYYTAASTINGFSVSVDLFERVDWNTTSQKFAQTSNALAGQSSLGSPILISSSHLFTIPIMVSNFTDTSQNIPYVAKITITPRNSSNRIFQNFHTGFVNKRLWLVGLHVSDLDTDYISHNGSNTSEVNDMLTSSFDIQISDFISVPRRSIVISTIQMGFVNQLSIGNGSFSDWDTEDLLSDINIRFSTDGHSINQDFDPGVERDMWNNPPPPP